MTHGEKNALILSPLPLVQQFKDALAEIAVLKARIDELTRPPKTPDNSSTPPSKAAKPDRSVQKELRKRIGRCREHLTMFVADRDMPATNNLSERALRPSVVFRKVTNGFRAAWGAETYAAFRSVVSTAKTNGGTVLAAVQQALRGEAACAPG